MYSWLFPISEAFRSLWRHRFVAMLSIITISAALFVLGFFITISLNLHSVLSEMQKQIAVEFFLKDGTTKADVSRLIEEISHSEGVASVEFITKSDAMQRFSKKFGTKYLEGLTDNPFPPSILVHLEPGINLGKTAEYLSAKFGEHPDITQIASPGDVAQKLSGMLKTFLLLSAIWGAILVVGALLIIINTIKLAIYGRRDTIEIMRLVGATKSFIQRPFTVEGFVQGFFAGTISALALHLSSSAMGKIIPSLKMPPQILLYSFALLGIIFGVIGSRMAVKKFL